MTFHRTLVESLIRLSLGTFFDLQNSLDVHCLLPDWMFFTGTDRETYLMISCQFTHQLAFQKSFAFLFDIDKGNDTWLDDDEEIKLIMFLRTSGFSDIENLKMCLVELINKEITFTSADPLIFVEH